MDPTPEGTTGSAARGVAVPLLVLLAVGALSAGRLAQGTPLDGLSLALHLLGSLAALRLVHPLWRLVHGEATAAPVALLPLEAVDLDPEQHPTLGRVSPVEVFDAYLASEASQPGARALPAGRAWLLGGPYAGLVFALLLVAHALVVPLLRTPLTLALLPVACAPLALWWWRGRAVRRARGGVALLLTPSQLIVRDAVGARSATWSEVQAVRAESKPALDMLRGARRAPVLLISRRGSPPLQLLEDELGVPVSQALAEVEGYRSAVLGYSTPASAPA